MEDLINSLSAYPFGTILLFTAVAVVCAAVVKLLSKPIKFIFKMLINTGLGFLILFIVNIFGERIGFTLGVSVFNAVMAGVFGVPGVILIILLKLFA